MATDEQVTPALIAAWRERLVTLRRQLRDDEDGRWAWLWRIRISIIEYLLARYDDEPRPADEAAAPSRARSAPVRAESAEPYTASPAPPAPPVVGRGDIARGRIRGDLERIARANAPDQRALRRRVHDVRATMRERRAERRSLDRLTHETPAPATPFDTEALLALMSDEELIRIASATERDEELAAMLMMPPAAPGDATASGVARPAIFARRCPVCATPVDASWAPSRRVPTARWTCPGCGTALTVSLPWVLLGVGVSTALVAALALVVAVRPGLAWYALLFAPVILVVLGLTSRLEVDRTPSPAQRCGRCGYDLRVSTSGRCPECGWSPDRPRAE